VGEAALQVFADIGPTERVVERAAGGVVKEVIIVLLVLVILAQTRGRR